MLTVVKYNGAHYKSAITYIHVVTAENQTNLFILNANALCYM